jgi:hypothetical protein
MTQVRVRVYIPLTLELLAQAVAAGGLGPAPFPAHAARTDVDADLEELEYDAMTAAAMDSLRLLGPDDPPVRVVVAADAVVAEDAPEDTAVVVSQALSLRDVAAVHADAPDAQEAVAAAVAAPDDLELAERVLDHELAWYAVQEVPDLLT